MVKLLFNLMYSNILFIYRMKTNTMKIPYVSLVRLSLEEINGYKSVEFE